MSDPPPASPHATQIDRLSQRLDEIQQQQSAMRSTLLIFSLVLVIIIVAFGYGLYSSVTKNLSAEKLKPALIERVEYYTPQLQSTATAAIAQAMPTYQELAGKELEVIMPKLRDEASAELEALPDKLRVKLNGRLGELRASLESEVGNEIKLQFGDIDGEQVADVAELFSDEIEKVGVSLQANLEKMYDEQANRVQVVLEKFDIPDRPGMTERDIQMKLIESAALLVAHLVQNPDELPVYPEDAELDSGNRMNDGESPEYPKGAEVDNGDRMNDEGGASNE